MDHSDARGSAPWAPVNRIARFLSDGEPSGHPGRPLAQPAFKHVWIREGGEAILYRINPKTGARERVFPKDPR